MDKQSFHSLSLQVFALFLIHLPFSAKGAPGDVDTGFTPGPTAGANSTVNALAIQPDGQIIIGGEFTEVNNVARSKIARLNADGSLDTGFDPGLGVSFGDTVYCVAVQPDGKILIGGSFSSVNGVGRANIARLNSNGSLDSGFDFSSGTNGIVYCMTLQPDGKVIIGGDFFQAAATGRPKIARYDENGTLDPDFATGARPNSTVLSAALTPQGTVVIGGAFTKVGTDDRVGIARLLANGNHDTTFDPGAGISVGGFVNCLAIQSDGDIVIGGNFSQVDGDTRFNIARLDPNGSHDTGFDTPSGGANTTVYSSTLQADQKSVIGGLFVTISGTARKYIARLSNNGSLETGFDPNAGGSADIRGIGLQEDGKVLAGGNFTLFNNLAKVRTARLLNGSATGSLSVPSLSQVRWLRGGTAPEAAFVTFQSSVNNGVSWSELGVGNRVAGGWELTGINIPASATIRARAFVPSGIYNGSMGIVETSTTAPAPTPTPAAPASSGGTATVTSPPDTWSSYYNAAGYIYQLYSAYGYYYYAAAYYYYYYALGDYYYHSSYNRLPEAYFGYYNGLGLYAFYAYAESGDLALAYSAYYGYAAFAYYYYYVYYGNYSLGYYYYLAFVSLI